MRAVLDPNVLIAALLSRAGPPGQLLARWLAGEFELVVSEELLSEIERALAHPKLRKRISSEEAAELVSVLSHATILAPAPPTAGHRSADPSDDYLLALAETAQAVLVSGDRHLLDLADTLPILTARGFLDALETG